MAFNVSRLRILARHLERLHKTPPDRRARIFSLAGWHVTAPTCRTTACAGGEACFVPEFRTLGLRLVQSSAGPRMLIPQFGDKRRFEALAALLNLSYTNSLYLFAPTKYPKCGEKATPGSVARRIRKLIRRSKAAA